MSRLAASATWARADLGRRWRWLVVLGVIAGLSAGLAMAALAGARRTVTALPRLSEATSSADAVVFPSQVGAFEADWSRLEDQPYVRDLARWNLSFGALDGEPGVLLFIPSDERWLGDVDRPVMIDGRMFDRTADDEVVVDENLSLAAGVAVGDTFTFTPYGPDQNDLAADPPNGPDLPMTVVGVIRFTSQFLFQSDGFAIPSPGVLARHGDRMATAENAHVRLRDPAIDMATLQRDVNDLLAPGTPVLDLGAVERRVATTTTVEQSALLVLAGLVALAGLVFVGQALARSVAVIDDSREALRAMGFTRAALTGAAVLPHLVVAASATATAVLSAVILSSRFPIGYAGRIDPDRGVHADWVVLGTGLAATLVLVVGGAAATAWVRGAAGGEGDRPARAFAGVASLRRLVPLPVGIGAAGAFDAGRGRGRVSARPALVGAVAAVLGLAATYTVDHGLDDALGHPERVGVTWQATVVPAPDRLTSEGIDDGFLQELLAQPGLEQASTMRRTVLDVNGAGVPTLAVTPLAGGIDLVPVSGRAPTADDEAAIGPATAEQLGVEVGDTVNVGTGHRPLRVVGEALFPPEVHAGFTDGLWVTPAAMAEVAPPTASESDTEWSVALRWTEGTDVEAAVADLGAALGDDAVEVAPAVLPPELTNLVNVQSLPAVLAGFLVLLATSTLAHGLSNLVRRRRQQFAILGALGFTRAMTRTVVGSHSTTVGLVGLAIGIPLGLAAGRLGWVQIAAEVPLQYVSPVTVALVAVLIPGALVLANAVAALPGWWASRLHPAEALRTE